jgi:hypothetical protein
MMGGVVIFFNLVSMNEQWKDVPDYEGLYQVSNLGNVKSLYKNFILKSSVDRYGYVRFSATKNKKQKTIIVHRLVAQLFVPNPSNLPQVNHKDGDKTNNTAVNLEWVTDSENKLHAYSVGLMTPGNQYKKRVRRNLPRYTLKSTNG